ncbi:MAG: sterol desaturase family protein [Rhodanobacteraceae bacterium]
MKKSQPAALQYFSRLSTSRFNANAGLTADCVIGLALIGAGLWRGEPHATDAILIVLAGLAIFSLVEYCVHRWLFHGPMTAFEQGHRRHHEQPLGYDALPFFLPPLVMLALAWLLSLFVSMTHALLLAGAISAGYACYGLSHTLMHATHFRNPLARKWAAAHHIHHNHPERNFGVTSPLWDFMLRTHYVSASKRAGHARR